MRQLLVTGCSMFCICIANLLVVDDRATMIAAALFACHCYLSPCGRSNDPARTPKLTHVPAMLKPSPCPTSPTSPHTLPPSSAGRGPHKRPAQGAACHSRAQPLLRQLHQRNDVMAPQAAGEAASCRRCCRRTFWAGAGVDDGAKGRRPGSVADLPRRQAGAGELLATWMGAEGLHKQWFVRLTPRLTHRPAPSPFPLPKT